MGRVSVFVPFRKVFPGEETESSLSALKGLLEELSRTDTIFCCARLNLILSNPDNADHNDKQGYCVEKFFNAEQRDRIDRFARERAPSRVFVFSRGQLLELIRWVVLCCKDLPGDGSTFTDWNVRNRFGRAALLASEIWGKRQFPHCFSMEGGREVARDRVLPSVRSSLAETSSGLDPISALGRGSMIFREYLPCYLPEFKRDFRSASKLTLCEYYICLSAMFANFLGRTPLTAQEGKSGLFNTKEVAAKTDFKPQFDRFLELESQTAKQLRESLWGNGNPESDEAAKFFLKLIRQRPISRAKDGRAMVLDPVFFSEKASVGPLFHVLKSVSNSGANQLFAEFGKAFESYAVDVIDRMYPEPGSGLHRQFVPNPTGLNQEGKEVEIADGLLDYGDEAVFFEMKTAWLPEESLRDSGSYRKILKERLGRGAAQIAKSISRLASRAWRTETLDVRTVERIYPVLVVHDELMSAPLHAEWLANEFDACLEPARTRHHGWIDKEPFRVARLILMTIKDLESLENPVEGFSLRDFLKDYSVSCADRVVSTREYMSDKYAQKIQRNRTLAAKSCEILDSCRAVFPDLQVVDRRS